jgi:hypothetical protein
LILEFDTGLFSRSFSQLWMLSAIIVMNPQGFDYLLSRFLRIDRITGLDRMFGLDLGSYCGGPEIAIVDAIDGKVLFSFASERPEAISKACLLKNSA